MLKHAGLSLQRERCITYLPTSRLGMDVVNNLVIFCKGQVSFVPPSNCLFQTLPLSTLNIASQSIKSILMRDVTCNFQQHMYR